MSTVRFVVRPGETEFDGQSRIQGSLDLPLTDVGQQQVQKIIEVLKNETFDVIYTSPTEPAATTAQMIGETLGVPVKVVEGLANLHLGLWQGMCLCDIRRKHPRVYRQWEDQPESVCAPDGEECDEALVRVEQSLKRPLKRDESFVVVAPEPIATLVCSVLRGEPARLAGPIPNGCGQQRVEKITPLPVANIAAGSPSSTSQLRRGLPSGELPAIM